MIRCIYRVFSVFFIFLSECDFCDEGWAHMACHRPPSPPPRLTNKTKDNTKWIQIQISPIRIFYTFFISLCSSSKDIWTKQNNLIVNALKSYICLHWLKTNSNVIKIQFRMVRSQKIILVGNAAEIPNLNTA